MALVALLVAALSLCVAVSHVAVNAATWRLSGPRVKVTWGWIFRPRGLYPRLAIKVANSGRIPATAAAWGIQLQDGSTLVEFQPGRGGPALPHRIEPQDSTHWEMDPKEMLDALQTQGRSDTGGKAFVQLATGPVILSRKSINFRTLAATISRTGPKPGGSASPA